MDYKARMYDAFTGRFIQPDTLVPEPGSSQGYNRYMYVNNNPVRYTDPNGHCFDGVSTLVCIALIGGIAGAIGGSLGYIIPTVLNGEKINGKSLAVSAGAGAITGALAPIIAITAPEAAVPLSGALFALSSGSQYAIDQKVNNKPVNSEQVILHAGIGGALGLITGGVYKPGLEGTFSSPITIGMDFTGKGLFSMEKEAAHLFLQEQATTAVLSTGSSTLSTGLSTSLDMVINKLKNERQSIITAKRHPELDE